MKTIAQIADEIGVSKQAIHQKIKQEPLSENLRKFTSMDGNTLTVDETGEQLIKSAFSSLLKEKRTIKKEKISTESKDDLISSLQQQVDDLKEELKAEKEKNQRFTDEILDISKRLLVLNENQQKLQATQLITDGKTKTSFWERFFKKKSNNE